MPEKREGRGEEPLEELARRETLVEIVGLMTVKELVVAVLRVDGLNDVEIARLLEVRTSVVSRRMTRAQRRIVELMPDAAGMVAGRTLAHGRRRAEEEAHAKPQRRREWEGEGRRQTSEVREDLGGREGEAGC